MVKDLGYDTCDYKKCECDTTEGIKIAYDTCDVIKDCHAICYEQYGGLTGECAYAFCGCSEHLCPIP